MSNIIDIKLEEDYTSFYVIATFGKDYSKLFGTRFMNIWNSAIHAVAETVSLVNVIIVKEKRIIGDMVTTETKWHLDNLDILNLETTSRLSMFYVCATYYRYIPATNTITLSPKGTSVSLSEYMTPEERKFYKGIGHAILCKTLKMTDYFRSNDYICLEASGGYTPEDMRKLTGYYESLGFVPISDSAEYLEYGYDDFNVVMYAKISDITAVCNVKARKIKIRTE